MNRAWQSIVAYCAEHKVHTQYSKITLNSFTDHESPKRAYPKLKGKGMEVKDLAAPLRHVWGQMRTNSTYEFALVDRLLLHIIKIQETLGLNSHSLFLPLAEAAALQQEIDAFLRVYTLLANKADVESKLLWSVVPKHD